MYNATFLQRNDCNPYAVPPLRVAGVNHYLGTEMIRLMTAYDSPGDPVWSHFPSIAADLAEPRNNEIDPLIHARQLGLHTPPTTDGNPLRSIRPRGISGDQQRAETRLVEYFRLASSRWAGVEYFTPAQLLWAAVESCQEDEDCSLQAAGTLTDLASQAARVYSSTVKNRIKELL